jgi:hypothetical protein
VCGASEGSRHGQRHLVPQAPWTAAAELPLWSSSKAEDFSNPLREMGGSLASANPRGCWAAIESGSFTADNAAARPHSERRWRVLLSSLRCEGIANTLRRKSGSELPHCKGLCPVVAALPLASASQGIRQWRAHSGITQGSFVRNSTAKTFSPKSTTGFGGCLASAKKY